MNEKLHQRMAEVIATKAARMDAEPAVAGGIATEIAAAILALPEILALVEASKALNEGLTNGAAYNIMALRSNLSNALSPFIEE